VSKKSISDKNWFASFFRSEAASAKTLLAVAALALLVANSPLAEPYFRILDHELSFGFGEFSLRESVLHWVNDGLMVIFFLLVGLEIKREVLLGELSNRDQAALPVLGALGGMMLPALFYTACNYSTPYLHGWAIPTATDIAFAIGVLSILGNSLPTFLKVFLTALAIIDDLGAVVIIATFYTSTISLPALAAAGIVFCAMLVLNRLRVMKLAAYLILGFVLWLCVLKSGVHATIAGVLTAIAVPALANPEEESPLLKLEKRLHPWVAFGIMPLFAFANAGVALSGHLSAIGTSSVSLGILLGLVLGKPVGIVLAIRLAETIGVAKVPGEISRRQLIGLAALGGIGFTMSLFVASLSFATAEVLDIAKLSILFASLCSAFLGYVLLRSR